MTLDRVDVEYSETGYLAVRVADGHIWLLVVYFTHRQIHQSIESGLI